MLKYAYLTTLLISLGGLGVLDFKYRLVWFNRPRIAAMCLAIGVGVFITWDVLGIAMRIFYAGSSPYVSGLRLAPEFPVEELFFLILLMYLPLVLWELPWRKRNV